VEDEQMNDMENVIYRMKNLQEFVVKRDWEDIPSGVIKYSIQHTRGQLARIFVHALTQEEAETKVDEWFAN
jgi:hypothetical protein